MVRMVKSSLLKNQSDKQLMKRARKLKKEKSKVNEKITNLKKKRQQIDREYKKTKKIVVER